tara:strand:- start:1513 stop:1635 length:123 start_codon:yes stop_codon:yes gene_type:complete
MGEIMKIKIEAEIDTESTTDLDTVQEIMEMLRAIIENHEG